MITHRSDAYRWQQLSRMEKYTVLTCVVCAVLVVCLPLYLFIVDREDPIS